MVSRAGIRQLSQGLEGTSFDIHFIVLIGRRDNGLLGGQLRSNDVATNSSWSQTSLVIEVKYNDLIYFVTLEFLPL